MNQVSSFHELPQPLSSYRGPTVSFKAFKIEPEQLNLIRIWYNIGMGSWHDFSISKTHRCRPKNTPQICHLNRRVPAQSLNTVRLHERGDQSKGIAIFSSHSAMYTRGH